MSYCDCINGAQVGRLVCLHARLFVLDLMAYAISLLNRCRSDGIDIIDL